MEEKRLEMLKQLAAGIAAQFGSNCEVVIHDVSSNHPDHSIVHIENGHVSGRKVGDGASQVVLDQMATQAEYLRQCGGVRHDRLGGPGDPPFLPDAVRL